ncbi:ArsR/SmtB family transcription factor [Agromyces binzhouensis]|uniref:ArsR/SmtB family transcription factor n=1 Tax=Agromyces binzhouensis TaxID=1817495 RepID=UPI0036396C49
MADADDELSLVFRALADPTRRAMLSRLHRGPATVGELAEPFPISRPAVSQHLAVLERAGLIERTVSAQWRTCTLRTEPLDEASEWVERHRGEWNERFDLLDEQLRRMRRGTP